MEILSTPQGDFELSRFPIRSKETLRAWDAADEYLIKVLHEEQLLTSDSNVLILNDSFGALSCSFSATRPVVVSDSFIAYQGLLENLQRNNIDQNNIEFRDSLREYGEVDQPYNLVLLKITKSLAQLEDQLHRIRPHIDKNTRIIASGMVKGIHNSTLQLFESIIGTTTTSLARKKARLIFSQFNPELTPPQNSYPKTYTLESTDYKILNHANVFSRERLDIGTRFLIENLPVSDHYQDIVDLGCGNGIVGLMAASANPAATINFVDESYMAVASAKENFTKAFPDREANFYATDCLKGILPSSCDLILNNPPFHQQNAIGDFIAVQMFKESFIALKPGGELWVIGNRHLGYHVKLKRLFGNCITVASNKKFVILKAIKN
ncbi:methyltransferase [Amphritea japonica]|uniref:Ribosomal RNA large subunit methyltransferase G n=1 Tax=Amphritea japonica ATCC BAA-1530 TaxID=1278309 RepID=A0A7R6PCR1_9GAMM|nr:methyltransferase [Amphritea japonica]BBB27622.1 16S rRNA (guanine1207-N2)-methyltransferase [Amphritea japonica ATCC BAA-1530]